MKELEKAYNSKQYEDQIYQKWEESGFFNPDNLQGEPFSIMMPPPNVTGVLHLGHALENTIMDTMIRFQRMQGKKALLLPGTDHAAVATQAKVEKLMAEEGIEKPRETFGRDGLLEKIRAYAEESKSTILTQIRKMGTSADWSRLAYTFDEPRNKAVNEVFVRMYNDGLIYKGYRVINWSVKGQSTCSDDELEYVDRKGILYTFKYTKDFPITIATTRPETKLGDTAVAVHPEGKWKQYIGQEFTVDVGAAKPLTIKVIGDEHVDDAFGTGALGVTPAHSPVDFEMYMNQKAKGDPIEIIQVIGLDGKMTAEAGADYEGLTVLEAREKFVQYLRENDLMEAEEETTQNVGTSDRFKDVVEPLPLTQWFVDVNKKIPGTRKSLKDLMKESVQTGLDGDKEKQITITPERFNKIYFSWIDNLRDWNISRQIWWGHRIPVWYKGEEIYCGTEAPEGDGWEQDEDTLDTWFSSGMWPFATLGWPVSTEVSSGKPENSDDFNTYFPTSWMQMGYEIIFFWMARMILMSTYTHNEIPFKDVYFHGMLRDKNGQKFSKSLGNGIDPIEVINEYGADALRYSLVAGISPGNDSKFSTEKIEGGQHLVNKFWNISRFILLNIEDPKKDIALPELHTLADKWIISRLHTVIKEVTQDIEEYRFSMGAERLREFTWSELADWYLEIAKIQSDKPTSSPSATLRTGSAEGSDILNYILNAVLKLWHPYMPFVTEAIWQEVYGKDEMLMVAKWPVAGEIEPQQTFESLQNIIRGIRALRAEYNISPSKKLVLFASDSDVISNNTDVLFGLARLETIHPLANKPKTAIGFSESGIEIYIDLADEVDIEAEKARLQKEIAGVEPYVSAQEKKLSNKGFVDNAPEAVVAQEKKKLEDAKQRLFQLKEQLQVFS